MWYEIVILLSLHPNINKTTNNIDEKIIIYMQCCGYPTYCM